MKKINNFKNFFKAGAIIAVTLAFVVSSIAIANGYEIVKKGELELIGLNNYVRFTHELFYPQENLTIEYNYNSRFLIQQECRLHGGFTDTLMIGDDREKPVTSQPVSIHIVLMDPDGGIIGFWNDLDMGRHTLDGGQLKDFPMLGEYTVQMATGDINRYIASGSGDDQEPLGLPISVICEDTAEVTFPVSYVLFDQIGYHYNETMNIWYSLDETEFMHIGLYNASGVRVIYWGDLSEGINAIQYTAPPDPPELEGVWTVQLINGDPADHQHCIRGEVECEDETDVVPCDNPRYAVVVTGSNSYDYLYDEFLRTTDHAYDELLDAGYTNANIFYLNDGPSTRPETHNQYTSRHSRDRVSTKANIRYALKDWLDGELAGAGEHENVVIYFVDHGSSSGHFSVKDGYISTSEMEEWIEDALTVNNPSGCKNFALANIVIDCCHSGTFLTWYNNVNGDHRISISSTDATHAAYAWNSEHVPNAETVFSRNYLDFISEGYWVEEAFRLAEELTQEDLEPWPQCEQYPLMNDGFFIDDLDPDDHIMCW